MLLWLGLTVLTTAATLLALTPLLRKADASASWKLSAAGVASLLAIGIGAHSLGAGAPAVGPMASVPAVDDTKTALAALEQLAAKAPQPAKQTAASKPVGGVDDMIGKLAAKLKQNPDDADGWAMLGWSYFKTERYTAAAEAYGKAVALKADKAVWQSALGETLVRRDDGRVGEQALAAFDRALEADPQDPRARFFKGMAIEQAGNPAGAVDAWIAMLETAPPGADWAVDVRQRVRELGAANNIDISARLPAEAAAAKPGSEKTAALAAPQNPGPTAADVAAAEDMAPADRQAMIEGMVDKLQARLDANPQDAEGWVKLIRSRVVMKQEEKAREALEKARGIFASSTQALDQINAAASQLGLTN